MFKTLPYIRIRQKKCLSLRCESTSLRCESPAVEWVCRCCSFPPFSFFSVGSYFLACLFLILPQSTISPFSNQNLPFPTYIPLHLLLCQCLLKVFFSIFLSLSRFVFLWFPGHFFVGQICFGRAVKFCRSDLIREVS